MLLGRTEPLIYGVGSRIAATSRVRTLAVDKLIGDLPAGKMAKDSVLIKSAGLTPSHHHGTADVGSQVLDQLGEVAATVPEIKFG